MAKAGNSESLNDNSKGFEEAKIKSDQFSDQTRDLIHKTQKLMKTYKVLSRQGEINPNNYYKFMADANQLCDKSDACTNKARAELQKTIEKRKSDLTNLILKQENLRVTQVLLRLTDADKQNACNPDYATIDYIDKAPQQTTINHDKAKGLLSALKNNAKPRALESKEIKTINKAINELEAKDKVLWNHQKCTNDLRKNIESSEGLEAINNTKAKLTFTQKFKRSLSRFGNSLRRAGNAIGRGIGWVADGVAKAIHGHGFTGTVLGMLL